MESNSRTHLMFDSQYSKC